MKVSFSFWHLLGSITLLGGLLQGSHNAGANAPLPLEAQSPIEIPNSHGGFDWMLFDAKGDRVYAAHPGAGRLTVLSVKNNKVSEYNTGRVNGVAVDYEGDRFFTAGGNQKVVVFQYRTMQKLGEIPLPGNADGIAFDPDSHTLYVAHDDGTELWAVDVNAMKLTGSIPIDGAPEELEYDPQTHRLYQNIKPRNEVQVVDTSKNAVIATWPTAPVESPHGQAMDAKRHWLFFAGNGKAGVIDLRNGQVISSVSFGTGYVDQIAFDPGLKRLYCACGNGYIAVLQETPKGIELLANVPDHRGAHTLAVDPHTHTVWISYGEAEHSYLQAFTAPQD